MSTRVHYPASAPTYRIGQTTTISYIFTPFATISRTKTFQLPSSTIMATLLAELLSATPVAHIEALEAMSSKVHNLLHRIAPIMVKKTVELTGAEVALIIPFLADGAEHLGLISILRDVSRLKVTELSVLQTVRSLVLLGTIKDDEKRLKDAIQSLEIVLDLLGVRRVVG